MQSGNNLAGKWLQGCETVSMIKDFAEVYMLIIFLNIDTKYK